MRIYSARALVWDGPTFASATSALEHWQPLSLTLIGRACIEFRRSGHTSDMVNLTRAKDAAACLALADLNTQETPAEAPRIRYFERAATSVQPST